MARKGVGVGEEELTFINSLYDPIFVLNCCTVIVFVLSKNFPISAADSCRYLNFLSFIFKKNNTFFMVTIDDETSNK